MNQDINTSLNDKQASVGDLVGMHQSLIATAKDMMPQIPAVFPTNDVMPIPAASFVVRGNVSPSAECIAQFAINGAYTYFSVATQTLTSSVFVGSFGSTITRITDDSKFPIPTSNNILNIYPVNFFPICPFKLYNCENKSTLVLALLAGNVSVSALVSFYK